MADLTIYQGEYKVFECTATEDSAALVLTGAAIYFAAYKTNPPATYTDDSNAVIAKSTATSGGITITDGAAGEFEIEFEKADTNALDTNRKYLYSIEAVLSGYTDPVVLEVGTIQVLPSYVRAV